jgi:uncharacterized YccA/Bax inhibitor family protein
VQIRTTNPTLNDRVFEKETRHFQDTNMMTLNGTVVKTGLLIILLLVTAGISASQMWGVLKQPTGDRPGWIIGGLMAAAIGGAVLAFVTCFVPRWSSITAPLYALLEGWVLGGISAVFEERYAYIVLQAAALTIGVLIALLVAYATRLIRATENFRLGVFAATGGIALVYLVSIGLSLFGVRVPYIHESGVIGIVFSLIVVVTAALNLVLDFDFIERGAQRGAPKYMEWYGGFGLLVTLVWLYLEILNLLAKLRDRRSSSM